MYFTKIELHNFGIYKGTHTIYLRDKISGKNITLIGGLNGRGKTTFHDAVILALYGRQSLKYIQEKARSYDKFLIDHINKHSTSKETYILVSLMLDDGTNLSVKRTWQLKDKKLNQEVVVEKNGIIDKYLGENWSYYIEEILPFGIAKFFFFNNEKITQLADDVSFEQIKTSIKTAIGISTIEKTIEHIEEVIKRKKNALIDFKNSDVNVEYQETKNKITDIEQKIKEASDLIYKYERMRDEAIVELEAKEKEFWNLGGELSLNRDKIKKEKERISDEVAKFNDELRKIATEPSTPLYMCKELVLQSYESEIAYQKQEALHYSDKIIFELHQQILDKLNKCHLDIISFDKVKNIVDEVLLSKYSDKLEKNNRKSISEVSKMLYEHVISSVFQSIEQQITSLIDYINEQSNKLLNLDMHLEQANEQALAMQLYEVLKSLEYKRAEAEAEYNNYAKLKQSLENQRTLLKAKEGRLLKAYLEKQNINDDNVRIIKYAVMSTDVLNEFKKRLQQEKIDKLSSTITNCFKELVEKDSLVSKIEINPDSLDINILDFNGKELLKTQLSAGEQQMFAVAVVWALALTSGYKAPVFIDTPMARLDSAHRINFVTKYLPAASSQVVVLSTDEEIYGQYLDLINKYILDKYTLVYQEEEQCTSIIKGYFQENKINDN